MSFYLRKYVSVGPFRFNLSKSGVGVSAGVRGARIGTCPRGNYVHLGRHGIYYRSKYYPGSSQGSPHSGANVPQDPNMTEIDSGDVEAMRDSSSSELLKEINSKRRLVRWAPIFAVIAAIAVLLTLSLQRPPWAALILVLLSVPVLIVLVNRDRLRKTTVVLYDLDTEVQEAYRSLHEAFQALMGASRIWHVEAAGDVTDRKRTAGAKEQVMRTRIHLSIGNPPYVTCNLEPPAVPAGRQRLYFFPDHVLVSDDGKVGAVSYDDLRVERGVTRFVEDEGIPEDSEVVDRTWRYVNKDGSPDRRFKNNVEIPLVEYEELHFKSASGLNELIQVSSTAYGTALVKALEAMGKAGGARKDAPRG